MAIHNFYFTPPVATDTNNDAYVDQRIILNNRPERVPDLSSKNPITVGEDINYAPEMVRNVIVKGFYDLDAGMKQWLGGIKIPVYDSYKAVAVHVVSHDRSVLSWAQEFFNGRVSLPVISIKRESWEFGRDRWIPPYLPMWREFTDGSRRRMRLVYHPIPFDVSYEMNIWSEFKHDAEYISSDVTRRCCPMGMFVVEDEYITQNVRVTVNSVSDSSDVDIDAKTKPKINYSISMKVEYSIPIHEKVVPTVLGKVISLKESDTRTTYEVYRMEDLL